MNRSLALAIAVALALLIAWFIRGTLLLVFVGSLIGMVLRIGATWLHRGTRLPMVISVWATFALGLLLLAALIARGGAAFMDQWTQLVPALQRAVAAAVEYLGAVPAIASALKSFDISALLTNSVSLLTGASGVLNSAVGLGIAVLVAVFVGVAGALEPELYRNGFLALFPPAERARAASVLDEVLETLKTWIAARAISMFATGLLVWVGLSVLHIPLAGALAVLAGALAFIPNIGAFIAGAPAVLIALASSPRLALAVLVMYWIAHFIDDFLISPFVERQVVRLPPILTLVAQIVLAMVAGILGIMLAAPIVAVLLVVVRRLWTNPLTDAEELSRSLRP